MNLPEDVTNADSPLPEDPAPAPTAPERHGAPAERRIQLALLLATGLTLALAGGLHWEAPLGPDPAGATGGWITALADVFARGWWYALLVFSVLGLHEAGHYLACRYHGIPASLPFFIPGPPPIGSFGALIRIRGPIPNRRALFDVAAAGPILGFALALPLLLLGLLAGKPVPTDVDPGGAYLGPPLLVLLLEPYFAAEGTLQVRSLFGAGWVGMLVTSLNLFPVGQLDGGHATYAISPRLHRIATRATLAALLLLMLGQVWLLQQVPAYLLWFGILLWMRDRHPRLADESGTLGAGRILVAILLVVILVGSFIPLPIILAG